MTLDFSLLPLQAGVGAARGTLMGGTVGAAVMGGMIGFSRAGEDIFAAWRALLTSS